ncbi:hypothetical protein A1OE_383 [Candidatus Endolissoclinum faulkneri L2]|uniref:Uncharacterized protein n=1 Tax=Candidatus Endolissoclinum faulkneri L2 TaxID=1193729 RepID=K7Z3L4_9PROT|nr:hypothetical protein A1OE_383 [Candidatus Endolissoclinum faulkneri L2]
MLYWINYLRFGINQSFDWALITFDIQCVNLRVYNCWSIINKIIVNI